MIEFILIGHGRYVIRVTIIDSYFYWNITLGDTILPLKKKYSGTCLAICYAQLGGQELPNLLTNIWPDDMHQRELEQKKSASKYSRKK